MILSRKMIDLSWKSPEHFINKLLQQPLKMHINQERGANTQYEKRNLVSLRMPQWNCLSGTAPVELPQWRQSLQDFIV